MPTLQDLIVELEDIRDDAERRVEWFRSKNDKKSKALFSLYMYRAMVSNAAIKSFQAHIDYTAREFKTLREND